MIINTKKVMVREINEFGDFKFVPMLKDTI